MEMLILAMRQQWHIHPKDWAGWEGWTEFPAFHGKKVSAVESRIEIPGDRFDIVISDLQLVQGAEITRSQTATTAMILKFHDRDIPDFDLRNESLLDTIIGKLGWEDINFDDTPEFSRHLLLKGKDEKAVKKFFSKPVRDLIEAHSHYMLEGRGNQILVFQSSELIKSNAIPAFKQFGEQFANTLQQ